MLEFLGCSMSLSLQSSLKSERPALEEITLNKAQEKYPLLNRSVTHTRMQSSSKIAIGYNR